MQIGGVENCHNGQFGQKRGGGGKMDKVDEEENELFSFCCPHLLPLLLRMIHSIFIFFVFKVCFVLTVVGIQIGESTWEEGTCC